MKNCILLIALLVMVGSGHGANHIDDRAVLFEGARLITGEDERPIEDSAFLVKGTRFAYVGNRGEIEFPNDIRRVDLSGKTVMPGLIDTHTHIGYERYSNVIPEWAQIDSSGRGLFNYGPQNFTYDNIIDHLSRLAYSGVSATWSAGYEFGEAPYKIRDEILAGEHPDVARYYPAGPGITTREAIVSSWARQSAFGVGTEAEARAAVARLAGWGVTQLKLWPHVNPAMSSVVYRAVIDEAQKYGIRVGFHPTSLLSSEEMIRAGAKIILHPSFELDSKLVKEYRPYTALTSAGGRREFYAPFLHPPDPLLAELVDPVHLKLLQNRYPNPKAEIREKSKAYWNTYVAKVGNLRAAGMRFALGSDSGGVSRNNLIGWATHLDMENMVAAGFTPAEVIIAATKISAESLRLDDLGLIAPGKEAAFVVLDANPLEDITNTRRINRVYLRGQEVDRAGMRARWIKSWPSGKSE